MYLKIRGGYAQTGCCPMGAVVAPPVIDPTIIELEPSIQFPSGTPPVDPTGFFSGFKKVEPSPAKKPTAPSTASQIPKWVIYGGVAALAFYLLTKKRTVMQYTAPVQP